MLSNVGNPDRVIRLVLGLGALGAGVYFHSWWGALGAIPLLTALIGWCPIYRLFGASTCRLAQQK